MTKFEDWHEAPEFEPDADERLEEMATTGRGPFRLAASVLLRADARAARFRRRAADTAGDHHAAQKPARTGADAPAPEPAPRPATATAPTPQPAPKTRGAIPTPARLLRARSSHQAKVLSAPPDPARAAADERAWRNWSASLPAAEPQEGIAELRDHREGPVQPGAPVRVRWNAALDRWAAREVALGMRLERALPWSRQRRRK